MVELENKRAFPMRNFIYNSIIVTNGAKIARLVTPTIENTFTHFSLTDLK